MAFKLNIYIYFQDQAYTYLIFFVQTKLKVTFCQYKITGEFFASTHIVYVYDYFLHVCSQ